MLINSFAVCFGPTSAGRSPGEAPPPACPSASPNARSPLAISFDGIAIGVYLPDPLIMLLRSLFERGMRLGNRGVAPFPLLLLDGLLLPALVFTPSLLLLECNDGFADYLIRRRHSLLRSRSGLL
jgi:hypothetical protein